MVDSPRAAPADRFLERARQEADRYGSDPWIFVRELIQNARDAGATRVHFVTQDTPTACAVTCTDDGQGMDRAHAETYLFSLYTSSKDNDVQAVGKFGVGFWSILRFEPTQIEVRSRPASGQGFGLALSGDLADARVVDPPKRVGTCVVLRKGPGDGHLHRRIADAARQNARFVAQRDDRSRELTIEVDDEVINAPFSLPSPRTTFSRGPIRGVVALGPSPRVELFSRGLRVRSAATLDDLLSAGSHTARARVSFPQLPGRLAPQVLLDHPGLELMLSRGDARDDRQLRGIVELARKELDRLVDRTVTHARGDGLLARWFGGVSFHLRRSLWLRTATAALAGVPLAFLVAHLLGPGATAPDAQNVGLSNPNAAAVAGLDTIPYSDLASRYHGPQVDTLDARPMPFALTYEPADRDLYFAALRFDAFGPGGEPTVRQQARDAGAPHKSVNCVADCVSVRLLVNAPAGALRLPVVPTMEVVTGSVHIDGLEHPVSTAPDGLPQIVVRQPTIGALHYRLGPTTEAPAPVATPPAFPTAFEQELRRVRRLPREERAGALVMFVASAVAYDRSESVALAHEAARAKGQTFLERAESIAAGDCDIQNAVLAAMLNAAGIPARLAVGIPGQAGVSGPWLHAWAEVQDGDGRWHALDASRIFVRSRPPDAVRRVTAPPPATDEAGEVPADFEFAPAKTPEETPALPPDASTQPTESGPPEPTPSLPPLGWLVLALTGATLGLALWARRTARDTDIRDDLDLSGLIDTALSHPDSFKSLPGIYTRPLVPTLGGGKVSLDRCRSLSARGRLYGAAGAQDLAAGGVRRGAALLDLRTPQARVVARALSTTDLDHWSKLLSQSQTSPLLRDLTHYFRSKGERWIIKRSPPGSAGLKSIDLTALSVKPPLRGNSRVVLVDVLDETIAAAHRLHGARPATALFMAADRVVTLLRIRAGRRAELLASAAGRSITEAGS